MLQNEENMRNTYKNIKKKLKIIKIRKQAKKIFFFEFLNYIIKIMKNT